MTSISNNNFSTSDYYAAVKHRLSQWLANFQSNGYDLVFSKLAECMESIYGIKTDEQKLRPMFNESSSRKIPLAELVALCKMLNIPLGDICELPNAAAMEANPPWIRKTTAEPQDVIPLSDSHYYGDYYCYYFHPQKIGISLMEDKSPAESLVIESAKLTIQNTHGVTTAVLKEMTPFSSIYKNENLALLEFTGQLHLFQRSNQVYGMLMEPSGKRFISLMFEYYPYGKNPMYYRTAAMMAPSISVHGDPIFQKMLLFRIEQDLSDPEIESIIRGLLTLNTDTVLIEKDIFNELAENDPEFERIRPDENIYYAFYEPELLNKRLPWTYEERIKRMLKIRQKSSHAAHEIICEDEYFSHFTKKLQQKMQKE